MKWFRYCNHDNDHIPLSYYWKEYHRLMQQIPHHVLKQMMSAYFFYLECDIEKKEKDGYIIHPAKFGIDYLRKNGF